MQQIMLILGFILSSSALFSTPGVLDTVANGGSGFGDGTPQTGIVKTAIGTSSTDDIGYASAIQADGKIVVVGQSGSSVAVVRYTIAGVLDTTFNSTGKVTTAIGASSAIARSVAIQTDGKIVVAGTTTSDFLVLRYNTNGTLDTDTFGSPNGYVKKNLGALENVFGVAIQTDGKIVVVGRSTDNVAVARLLTNGNLDPEFNGGAGFVITSISGTAQANAVAIQSDGKIVIAGTNISATPTTDLFIARYNTNGTLDATFGTGGYVLATSFGQGHGVAIQSDGSIVASGFTSGTVKVTRYSSLGVLDTSGFGTSGVASQSLSSVKAYSIIIQPSDQKIIVNTKISSRLGSVRFTTAGILDTTWNPSGIGGGLSAQGITSTDMGGTVSDIVGILLQPNNKVVLNCGTDQGSTGINFGVLRYVGDTPPQGCIDVTYQTNGYVQYAAGSSAAYNPQITGLQAQSNNMVYVVGKDLATTTQSRLVKLNSDGSTALSAITITQAGASDVITNSQGKALVIGTTSNGWVRRYTTAGSFVADTSFGTSGLIDETTNSSSFKRVGEQISGRYIVMGQGVTSSTGIVIGYTSAGVLDTTFGISSTGFYSLASRTFSDMVIDSTGKIYVVDTGATNIQILRILADGSGLDTTFGPSSHGYVDTGLATASYGSPSISFDNNGNIMITAVATATGNITFQKYLSTATSDTPSVATTIAQTTHLLTNPVIKQLQSDTDSRAIFTGYDDNVYFVARLNTDMTALDTTFAPNSSYTTNSSAQGILTAMYNSVNPIDGTTPKRVSNAVTISASGTILFGGYEAITSTTATSLIGNVVGDASYSQVPRYYGPPFIPVGAIDTSFGTAGALSLAASPASLPAGQAKVMRVLSDNKILVAVDTGTDTVLGQLTSAYVLDTGSFGSGTGLITLTGLATPKNIMVDVAGNIYVVGDNAGGTASILKKITSNGSGVSWTASTNITLGDTVCQQASGRILVAGYDSTYNSNAGSGVIIAYNPSTGAIDTSFNPSATAPGAPGYYYTGVAHEITSLSVCTTSTTADKILIAYESGTTAIVQRILENGTALDSLFTFGTGIPSVSADTQIKMQLDANGKIVLTARTSTGFVASRYTAAGADDVINVSIDLTNPLTASLQRVLCLSDATTLILGMNTNGNTVIAADLTSDFALNTSFNTTGLLQTAVSPMVDFYAIDVTADEGIIVCGDNNATTASANPYMTRIVNDVVVTKAAQGATSTPSAGALDTTLNPAGTTAGFMNFASELQTTSFPTATTIYALLQKTNGSYYVAGSTSSNSYITLMSDDDVQDAIFGRITIAGSDKTNVSSMLLGQDGNLLVAGAGAGTSGSGWIVSLNPSTGAVVGAFAPTTTLDSHYAIVQQTSGRILVAGVISGVGKIIAYNSVTGAIDTTFGSSGYYTATGYGAINSILVDATDNIYFMANDSSNNAKVVKLVSSGTGAASGWTIPTVTTDSTIAANNHLAFNQAGNLVAVAVDTTTPQIVLKTITVSSGSASAALNLAVGSTGIATPKVTAIMVDMNTTPGKVILSGYDDQATDVPFILRTNTALTALDTTFNSGGANPGVQAYNTLTSGVTTNWYAGMINANGKITVAGYASALTTPYLMRVYGDEFVGQYAPTVSAGTPGTIDTNFGASGQVLLASLSGAEDLATATSKVVIPTSAGQYYIALDNPTSIITQVVRLTNGALLDTTFNPDGTPGFATNLVPGVTDMIVDGLGQLVVVGINAELTPYSWITRYVAGNAGTLDPTFNSGDIVSFDYPVVLVNKVVEQTLGRYILAGTLDSGNGYLVAVTNSGVIDTTFNSQINPGYYDTGITTSIYGLITDLFDRIIIAYKNGTGIDICRLTSAGQLDTTFGSSGTISGAIANADSASQVRLTFDASGNIVIAAHFNDGANKIAVKSYANDLGTSVVETQYDITGLTSPTLTNLITTADSKVLLSGYQSGTNDMWVARIKDNGSGAYTVDTTFGGGDGVMTFSFDGSATARSLQSIAIYGDGEIAMVGTETVSAVVTPFLSMAYDNPYTTQIANCQDSKSIGTNDTTFGASSTTATNLGVTFFASSGGDATSGQVARAVALQDDANILVAVDGGLSSGSTTPSDIFLKRFNIDGVADTTFGTSGQRTVLATYANQYVQDLVTFTTVAGVHKAILAGYTYNSALPAANQYSSLLLQYNLDTPALDIANFGGFNGNAQGIAFGDGKQINVVGLQSNGRIIAAGQSKDDLGLLLGYTVAGKLDMSFGTGGGYCITSATESSSIYTHAIDTQNRIIIAYRDEFTQAIIARFIADGSALDTSFNSTGTINTLQTTYSDNGIRVAVDSSNNVFAAVVADNYESVTIYSYNGANGSELYTPFTPSLSLTHFTISKLLIDTDGKVIVVGYDNTATDKIVIACMLADLSALDVTFNPSGTPGYLKYGVAATTVQVATDGLIHPDGRIIVVGSEN